MDGNNQHQGRRDLSPATFFRGKKRDSKDDRFNYSLVRTFLDITYRGVPAPSRYCRSVMYFRLVSGRLKGDREQRQTRE